MVKIYKIFCLIGFIIVLFSNVVFASAFQTVTDDSLPIYKVSDKSIQYNEGTRKIIIRIHKASTTTDEMLVYRNNTVIYQKTMSHNWSYRIYQLQDAADNRFVYLINSDQGCRLMGYDAVQDKWQLYASSSDFYNSVHATPWLQAKNGDIILSFQDPGKNNPAQKYRLFWDTRSNWFGYEDLGISNA